MRPMRYAKTAATARLAAPKAAREIRKPSSAQAAQALEKPTSSTASSVMDEPRPIGPVSWLYARTGTTC